MMDTLPKSNIYCTPSSSSSSNSFHLNIQHNTHANTQLAKNLILDSNAQYTPEDIRFPNGQFPCYYCPNRPINTPLYFVPSHQVNEHQIMMHPMAHCHPSCVLGTINNMPNNFLIRGLFEEIYPDTPVPPPRCCFHIKPVMTVEDYFNHINSRKTLIHEDPLVRTFFAPLHLSTFSGNVQDIPISNFSSHYGHPDVNAGDIGQRTERQDTPHNTTATLNENHRHILGKVFPLFKIS